MIQEYIIKLVRESYKRVMNESACDLRISVDTPAREEFGDYAAVIEYKMLPRDIRRKIAENIKDEQKIFVKIDFLPPVFINFFLSAKYLQEQVEEILEQGDKYGQSDPPSLKLRRAKKVQVEFISANPTGPLTVGNARGGPFGDVLANVLRKAGFEVEKAYYVNDLGKQVEALGHSVLKDDQAVYKGSYIDELNKRIKEKDACEAGRKAAKIITEDYIKQTAARAKIKFDAWYYESKMLKYTDDALSFLKSNGLIYEKEGAQWFKSSKFGDERDRVVIKSDGDKTYLAGDLGLHKYKFEKKKFDKVINIWGADHFGDVPGLTAGVDALGHKGKLEVILLQFVTLLKKGEKFKISKRKGNVVTLKELLDEVEPDAMRFFFLQKSVNTHLNFDLDLAKEQSEKNPVYYVQYAHARICSILRKAKKQTGSTWADWLKLNHPSELRLIKQLIRLPEVVEDTARDYQVQRLPKYARDLATDFHKFYTDCRVLDEKNEKLTRTRLALVLATKIVLKNTLELMGISAPEKM